MQQMTPRQAALTAIATLGLVGALFTPAAAAKGKDDAPGQAKKADAAASTWTEDNDTNDGGTANNVVDAGDNKHPSGKDRSVEHGRSGVQGNATSDPDDDGRGPDRSNGGPDKPNGSGGVDLADQDHNNGCGNDDDFEDDNEGWCGGKPKAEQPEAEKPAGQPAEAEKPSAAVNVDRGISPVAEAPAGDVLGAGVENEVAAAGGAELPAGEVLDSSAERPAAVSARAAAAPAAAVLGGALAFTGASTGLLVTAAIALLAVGLLLVRTTRRRAGVLPH
jgi:hypothetical protein